MKKFMLVWILILISIFSYSQDSISEVRKMESLCKVWGFLKYYQNDVVRGKYDWDAQLFHQIELVDKCKTKAEINNCYLNWLKELKGNNRIKEHVKSKNGIKNDEVLFNSLFIWGNDTTIYTIELRLELLKIFKGFKKYNNYYTKETNIYNHTLSYSEPNLTHEKDYKEITDFPHKVYRLLTLFRYWNYVNYYYPYKDILDEKWDNVLTEMLPQFLYAQDAMDYNLAILELTTKTQDCHSVFVTKYIFRYFGIYYAPFKTTLINDTAIVTGFYNDSLAKIDDIRKGDIIVKINDTPLSEIINKEIKYTNGYNKIIKVRNLGVTPTAGNENNFWITYIRNNEVKNKMINRYSFDKFKYKFEKVNAKPWKIINDNIGYVDMETLQRKQVRKMMNDLKLTKAIIFDLRNYPNRTVFRIVKRLNNKRKAFDKIKMPNIYPGTFILTKLFTKKTGHKKYNFYKGTVIVLINEMTQSRAEFTCMALQTAPKVKLIGSPTAGSDGTIVIIPLPGGYTTWLTNHGVYYPDGTTTQKKGIQPDIYIYPTVKGLSEQKDEVLDGAIDYIKKNVN